MNKAGCISEQRPAEVLLKTSRKRHLTLAVLLLAAAGSVCLAAAPAKHVTDVRFWSTGDITRVAIQVSAEFTFKSDRLNNPARLFFDIPNSDADMVGKGMKSIPVGDALLKQIRIASNQPGSTRVVLDLEDGVEFTASQLSNPERLMIELRSTARTTRGASASSTTNSSTAKTASSSPAPAPEKAASKSEAKLTAAQTKNSSKVETAKVEIPRAELVKVTEPIQPPEPPRVEPKLEPVKEVKQAAAPKSADNNGPEPKAASRLSNGDRSMTRVLGLKLGRVVIDAGHGGNDPGTHGKSGIVEKDLTLDIAKRLAILIRERMGSEVVMTRTDDNYISLEERTQIANDSKADLFLSIHANSSPIKTVAGIETYYLNFSTSRDDMDLASRENAASSRSIGQLREVLSKIALRAKLDESREFALRLQSNLHTTAQKQNKEAKDRGIKKAPFVVLIGADMPSVLAEIGYLSNPRDEQLLRTSDHKDKIAEALYRGIASYAESLSRVQVARSH